MKEFSFGRTKFKITWEGEQHEAVCPSHTEIIKFHGESEQLTDLEKSEKMLELLVNTGLPKAMVHSLETAQVIELFTYFGEKKS